MALRFPEFPCSVCSGTVQAHRWGIAYSSAEGDGVLAWDGVERWREAAGHLLIYVSGSTYLLVPVDGLSPEVRDAVENALRDRVSPPGRRPRRLR